MNYLLAIIAGYLVGTFNTAYIISRIKGVDLRKKGSGNLGASNTTVLLGWKLGVLVGLIDILKGTAIVLLFRFLLDMPLTVWLLSGTACILGHIFPFYLGFKGGKGFATIVGVILGYDWRLFIVIGIGIILITLITNYIVLATTATVLAFPTYVGISTHNIWATCIILPVTLIILYKHIPNLKRIFTGQGELTFRSATKGENLIAKEESKEN